ncbi:MAG: hypothetical protein ACJ0G0_03920 [Alphaproteobacteria bacterium]
MIIIYTIFLYFFSIYVIKKSIFFFNKYSIIDYPTDRSNHKIPTPRGAGLIIIPVVAISTLIFFYLIEQIFFEWIIIFLLCFLLGMISFIDDIKNLGTKVRLFLHFFIVSLSLIIYIEPITMNLFSAPLLYEKYIPLIICFLFVFILISWMWIINLYNFMDGIDGLTALQVCTVAVCTNFLSILGYINEEYQYFSLILFSVYLAFYQFNQSPAKIFLGDVGSIPSGYLVGFIMISCLLTNGILLPIVIVNMYYILDSSITLLIRFYKRDNVLEAHSDHFYQKMIRKGYQHSYVIKWIFALNSILLILSLLSMKLPIISFIFSILLTTALLYLFYAKKEI